MRKDFDAQVVTIFVGEDDKWKSGLLYPAVVERLTEAGLAGITVLQGIEGVGAHHKLHTNRFESLFQSLPVVIEAVDTREKVAEILPILDEMLVESLVTIQDIKAYRYTKE